MSLHRGTPRSDRGGRRADEADAVALTPEARTPRAGTQATSPNTRLRWSGLLPVAALTAALLAGGVAVAGPAAAAQDPAAPRATVTRGPSCDPGGMEILVTAGTAPFDVVLATTRDPGGEDAVRLQPGATALLHTGPVDWGETVDPRLEYTAADASGTSFVDELDDWSMTRPSKKDCAAIGAPAAVSPTSAPVGGDTGTSSGTTAPPPGVPAPTSVPAPDPDSPDPVPPAGPSAVVASGAAGGDGPSSRAVGAGQPITVRATGFEPGEEVTVRLVGGAAPLGRATAGPDGTVDVPLFVPADSRGPTRLDVVGARSGITTGLRLQVAAQQSAQLRGPSPVSWPALLALLSLVASGGGLVAALGRRAGPHRPGSLGSA